MDNDNTQPPAPPAPPAPPREKRQYHRRHPIKHKMKLVPRLSPEPRTQEKPMEKEPAPSKETMLFSGMTAKLCASGCNPEKGCVISGDICVHPYISGGLQSPHQMKPAVKQRFEAAKDYLKHQAIDQRKEA